MLMKPGSLDSSGDVEYYVFYIFALQFLVFEIFKWAFFGTHFVTVLTWGEGEATLHVNRCSKLTISGLIFDTQ